MTTLGPVTKLRPRRPGIFVFVGVRHIRNALYEHIVEVVQVMEIQAGKHSELFVAFLGRYTRYPLVNFDGTWTELTIEETP